jgi:hypothetical protein
MTTDLSGSTLANDESNTDLSGAVYVSDDEGQPMWGLRLRSQIQSLTDGSSEVSEASEEEAVMQYRPSIFNDYSLQSAVLFIRFFNLSAEWLRAFWQFLTSVVRGVKRGLRDNIYVFFQGSSYPYYLDDIQMSSPAIPSVEWYYNAKTHTFISGRLYNASQQYHTQHIPYLTAEVKYNDLTLYDISDFIDSVRWAGEEGEVMPNADHLVSAWTLSSGIVLQRSEAMALSVINTNGEDMRVPLLQ